MIKFGPLADPAFEGGGNVLLGADAPDESAGRFNFLDNRGQVVQVCATLKEDGLHVHVISSGWGIAQTPDGRPVIILD